MKKTVGIIGGMGPLATADLFTKIIRHTKADSDQGHLHIVIDNNTAIPDRTAAICGVGASPLPELIKSADTLMRAGADFLVMPCNTAHHYHAEIQSNTPLPLLHMIKLTAEEVRLRGCRVAGLLATDGVLSAGVYDEAFAACGVSLVKPDDAGQRAVMSMIYDDIKGGRQATDVGRIRKTLDDMQRRGAECFVLGCTELPLAFAKYDLPYPTVDATDVLAQNAVLFAGGTLDQ